MTLVGVVAVKSSKNAMEHKFMHERPLLEVVHQDLPEVDWLKETFQEIRNVQFKFEDDPAFEGGAFYLPESDLHPPRIVIAAGGVERFARLKHSREDGVRAVALQLGIPFEQIDGKTIQCFILFHEAGHAYDFLINFANGVDVKTATKEWRANSNAQLNQLPLPGIAPAVLREDLTASGFDTWLAENPAYAERCHSLGISKEVELLHVQEEAYRQLDKERYADEFAVKALLRLSKSRD